MKTNFVIGMAIVCFMLASPRVSSQTFSWPLPNPVVSQEYGCKDCLDGPNLSNRYLSGINRHAGIDLDQAGGAGEIPVLAAADGEVEKVVNWNEDSRGLGNTVIVRHGNRYSLYAHLDEILVVPGQEVFGQLSQVGTMGHSTSTAHRDPNLGVHLHFEIKADSELGSADEEYVGYTPGHPDLYGYYDPAIIVAGLEVEAISATPLRSLGGSNIRSFPGTVYALDAASPVVGQIGAGQAVVASERVENDGYYWYFSSLASRNDPLETVNNGPDGGWIREDQVQVDPTASVVHVIDEESSWIVREGPGIGNAAIAKVYPRQNFVTHGDSQSAPGCNALWRKVYLTGDGAIEPTDGWICSNGLMSEITWSPPSPLNTNAIGDSYHDEKPQLSTDSMGTWIAVWEGGQNGDNGISFSSSVDNGKSWRAPAILSHTSEDFENDQAPQVVTDKKGTWIAVWESWGSLGNTIGTDPDILYAKSSDRGKNWTDPSPLNTNASTDTGSDRKPHIAVNGLGTWIAVWESTDSLGGSIGPDPDILFARSTNAGSTWELSRPLDVNAVAESRLDQNPRIATNDTGIWVAVWDSSAGPTGAGDIFWARSTDDGLNWDEVKVLNSNAGHDGADDITPDVATDGSGNWVVVWSSDGGAFGNDDDVVYSRSTDDGLTWSQRELLNPAGITDRANERSPHVVTDGSGVWVSVWYSILLSGVYEHEILSSRSIGSGDSWSTPQPLNFSQPFGSGAHLYPAIGSDGLGNWIVAWKTEQSASSVIGSDADVLSSLGSSINHQNVVWVNSQELEDGFGTSEEPFNSLVKGVASTKEGGTVHVSGESGEMPVIGVPVRLVSYGGVSRIGVRPTGNISNPTKTGFVSRHRASEN